MPVLKYPGEKALGGSWLLAGEVQIIPDAGLADQTDVPVPMARVIPAEIAGVKNYTNQITRVAIGAALGVLLFTRSIERALAVLWKNSCPI